MHEHPLGKLGPITTRLMVTRTRLLEDGRPHLALFVRVFELWFREGLPGVLRGFRRRRHRGTEVPVPIPAFEHLADARSSPSSIVVPGRTGSGGVSIVIPVLNQADVTLTCLKAIVENTPPGTYEVIVVDNGSHAATQDALASVRGISVIRNPFNEGFVLACNRGAAAARGEFVVFLNNDTIPLPGWLEALVSTFEQDPTVGGAGAKLIFPDGRLQEAGGIIWSDGAGWNYGRDQDPAAAEYNFVREVDYCSGACLMVRRTVLQELGGFDTRYSPAYYEDTDLCFRLRESGYRVLYQPRSQVIHLEGATAGTDTTTGFKQYQELNRETFVARHRTALAQQYPHDPRLVRAARNRRGGTRVLVVDHMVPQYDRDSGSVRMTGILRILVELGCRVTFLPDNLARVEPYASELQRLGIEVLYGPSGLGFVERYGAEFDVAILCRVHFAAKVIGKLRKVSPRPYILFDTVDLHHLREMRLASLGDDPALHEAAQQTRRAEMSVMAASDMVWLTSTYEAGLLRENGCPVPMEVIPNIHAVKGDVPPFGSRRDLLFVGGFGHPPNEDAVLYFAREIFPTILRRLPDVRFLVAGPQAPPRVQALHSEQIQVLGHVPDLERLLDVCRVSVAPLRYGAGVKGKITQSLSVGVPVVTTSIGSEGLQLVHGEQLLVADRPDEFAEHVLNLYSDEALWNALSSRGRAHAEEHLSHGAIRARIAALLGSVERRSVLS